MNLRPLVLKFLIVLALVAIPLAVDRASAAQAATPREAGYVPGEVIVKFKAGLASADRTRVLHSRGAGVKRRLRVPGTALVRIPVGQSVRSAVKVFERDPAVEWAEPNAYREAQAVPNDPFFDQEWGLTNSGQEVNGHTGAADADIDAPEAWERTTGSPDVKVAVLDSGINFGAPDLAPNMWRNPGESGSGRESNGVDDDGNGFVDDWRGWDFVQHDNDPSDNYGHGTHVAGTLAAHGNDGVGISGVAWRASIIPVRVLDNEKQGTCADIADGLAYAARAGARVVNMSIGSPLQCQAERDAIEAAPNMLVVIGAANEGTDNDSKPYFPCSFPSANIVCVAATDSADQLAGFSNYGAQSVDLAAPGVSTLSAWVKFGPEDVVLTDGFEDFSNPWNWVTGGTPNWWIRTSFPGAHSGFWSLSNSVTGAYTNNTDNWARLTSTVDLRNKRACFATMWFKGWLGPPDGAVPEEMDRFTVEQSPDGVHWESSGTLLGGTDDWFLWSVDASELEGRNTGSLRLRLRSTAADTYDGVNVDDLRISCFKPDTEYSGARDEYDFDEGTSMAAPHVAGVAVLLLSLDPGMTAGQLKARIMETVDPLPSLAGKTVTGGRLNAARAVDLPPRAGADVPAGGGPSPGPGALPGGTHSAAMAAALAKDLKAVIRSLRVRRGRLTSVRLHALEAGRFTLALKSTSGKVLAKGGCSRERKGVCTLRARLTRGGRSLLRPARRPRVKLELSFAPRSGASLVRRASLTLR